MIKPKISVIMSVYNGEKYLREAIESVLTQTFTDFEFIIVNDGSTDGSLETIQSYDDERIRIVNNQKNIGLTRSLNKALEVVKGEYVARQDADDISLPGRFEEQIKYFEEHPEVALLGTSVYIIDEDGRVIGKNIAVPDPTNTLRRRNPFTHGTVMFRREIVDKLGGYNELLKYSQDYELWLRVAKYYEVRNLTAILYKLRYHGESIWCKNTEQAALYSLLAVKIARGSLDKGMLRDLESRGVELSHSYLTKSERIKLYKTVARTYIRNNNVKLAREAYRKILSLGSLDFESLAYILLSQLIRCIHGRWYKVHSILKSVLKSILRWFERSSL